MFDKNRLIRFGLFMLYAVSLLLCLLRYYNGGKIIGGGEGAYILDYINLLKNFGFSWTNWGTGTYAVSMSFGYIFHLFLVQFLTQNERILNFVVIYSIFLLPFLAIYALLLKLKLKPLLAFTLSLFYVFNPFSIIFLNALNQWNVLALYVLPAFLYIILKFYDDNLKLFLIFGVHSFVFAFTNANAPTMVLFQVALVILVLFATLHKEKKYWKISIFIKKYLVVLFSFFTFNLWWILHWFYIFQSARAAYSTEFAISWLKGIQEFPVISRTLSLEGMLGYPITSTYDFFSRHYSPFFVPLLMIFPIAIIVFSFFEKKIIRKDYLFLLILLTLVIFLAKGTGGIFGGVYEFMVMNIPVFNIFKSANEKWGILLILIFTLLLAFSFRRVKGYKHEKKMYLLFCIYVVYISLPFITGNITSDYMRDKNFIGSRFFTDKKEYQDVRIKLNNDNKLYRVLALPGSGNYQVALKIENNKYYTGNDPILSNTNKPFIAPYNGSLSQRFPVLFKNISKSNYLKLFGPFNIGKIVLNKDEEAWFGFQAKESITEIEKILDQKLTSQKGEAIDIYDTADYFYPRFYVPTDIIKTDKKINSILDVISQEKISDSSRMAILFDGTGKDMLFDRNWKVPKITFTQVNPSKYKVHIDGAADPYLLVLSESFHPGWKVYLNDNENTAPMQNTNSYFNGDIVENSDAFRLIDENFNETWNKKSLPEEKHITVNGYANSWLINPGDVGETQNYGLIIEYWPQRLFYTGLIIAISGFVAAAFLLTTRAIYRSMKLGKIK